MKSTIIVAAFATILTFTPALASQNLVTNGGFETGDFSGWTQVGDMSSTTVYPRGQPIDSGPVYPVGDGQFSAAFGPLTGLGGITQTIDTIPGKRYNVSFDLANSDTENNNQFVFSFDDGFQINAKPFPSSDFTNFSIPVIASGLTADVSFLFYNPAGYFLLDDVSVIPAVPEPASWSLLLAGFGTIGAALRRRNLLAVEAGDGAG